STETSEPVSAFRSVDLPTFVYPASATVGVSLRVRSLRRVARCFSSSLSRRRSCVMRRRAIRRSLSSCDSPGPRGPTPPPRRRACAVLHDGADRLDAGRAGELVDLRELLAGIRTLSQYREDEPALGLRSTWNHRHEVWHWPSAPWTSSTSRPNRAGSWRCTAT